jgi:proteasome accessory factor A
MPCLFGAETEYALAAITTGGTGAAHGEVHHGLMTAACDVLPHLLDESGASYPSLFLANAGRIYYDCGYRIELATPEVTTPWELVRYVRAGDAIVRRAADRLAALRPEWREVFCSRASIDHVHRTAWGFHESYLLRGQRPGELRGAILPHLVSRIVYTGAGGFDGFHPGLRFLISPRAAHTVQVAAENTMRDRPIFSTRDEPLAREPYRRLHVACAERLCGDLGLFLQTGATALVTLVIERNRQAVADLALGDPVAALRAIAADPACRCRVALEDGRTLSAIEIQRAYLERVEAAAGSDDLPDWAPEVCRTWHDVLDRLEEDPESLGGALDWVTKWTLFRRWLARNGADETRDAARLPDLVVEPGPATSDPASQGRRMQLFELDLRWGELGPRGIFDALDRRGELTHQVRGCDRIAEAIEQPPRVGRARIRGEVVRRLWQAGRPAWCTWDGIDDLQDRRSLDLSDPFEETERWA